jgi:hypothetical protein
MRTACELIKWRRIPVSRRYEYARKDRLWRLGIFDGRCVSKLLMVVGDG